MDPLTIAALIGGGGSLLSSIFGGISESNTANQQNAVNAQNVADTKLGSIDAKGNRTRFVDGLGWVSTYGPTDQKLENYFLSQELPKTQDQFQRNANASRGQDDVANSLLDEFRRTERVDPAEIEKLLYAAAGRGIGESTRAATEPAMRAILRSGATNGGKILQQINKGSSDALAKAAIDSKLQALDYADTKYKNDRGNTTDLYNSFSGKAAAPLYPSTNAGNGANALMQQFGGANTSQQIVADNGLANALGGAGSALSGVANSIGATQQNNRTNALLENFLNNSGLGNISSGGVLGSVNERAKNRSGVF